MDGTLDLSFEAFQDLENIPTAKGRGWLASKLNRDDWTVKMSDDGNKEIVSMVNEMIAYDEKAWKEILSLSYARMKGLETVPTCRRTNISGSATTAIVSATESPIDRVNAPPGYPSAEPSDAFAHNRGGSPLSSISSPSVTCPMSAV